MIVKIACKVGMHNWDRGNEYPEIVCQECETRSTVDVHPSQEELWF